METLFRFDDASVSPTSLQNVLNTPSAYVIFYEMLETTRNQIVSSTAASAEIKPKVTPAVSPAGPERKVIGPQQPSPAPSVAKIPPSPMTIPSNPKQGPSLLVTPKVITESPIIKKPPPAPVKAGGLVPYDGGSDSDEEVNNSPPTPIIAPKPATAATTSPSSFLPRAVNLKKLMDTIQKEDAPSFSMNNSLKTESKKTESNGDPSSEILYAKENSVKEEPKTIISQSRNEFHVRDIDSHSPSVHSDNSSGSTTSFTVSDIGSGAVRSGTTDTVDATAGTPCEATTSQSHEKASSSKLSADQDEDRQKKHKKRKSSGPERKVSGSQLPSSAPSDRNNNVTLHKEDIQWDHIYGSVGPAPGLPEHNYVTHLPHHTPPRRTKKAGGEYWNIHKPSFKIIIFVKTAYFSWECHIS